MVEPKMDQWKKIGQERSYTTTIHVVTDELRFSSLSALGGKDRYQPFPTLWFPVVISFLHWVSQQQRKSKLPK